MSMGALQAIQAAMHDDEENAMRTEKKKVANDALREALQALQRARELCERAWYGDMASSPLLMTQQEIRREVTVGDHPTGVIPVAILHREGYFRSEEAASGAFLLAHQQGLDGMGNSPAEWMGLSHAEFAAWSKNFKLPPQA